VTVAGRGPGSELEEGGKNTNPAQTHLYTDSGGSALMHTQRQINEHTHVQRLADTLTKMGRKKMVVH